MNANTIVDALPAGYRFATDVECARFAHPAYFARMVQVRAFPWSNQADLYDQTDLAIRI